jgi:hypothetical protein
MCDENLNSMTYFSLLFYDERDGEGIQEKEGKEMKVKMDKGTEQRE